jgi:hypothetical protein
MANGYLIIDGRKDGLPEAAGYYRTFPLEPSPLGDILLSTSRMSVMSTSSLDTVLGEMPKAGAGGIVVLVCHAIQDGMLLTVAPTGRIVFALVNTLGVIDKVNDVELEVARIRQLPRKTPEEVEAALARWKKLFDGIQPGTVVGMFTIQEAEVFYSRWLDDQARRLEFPNRAALQQMLAKLRKVRLLKLSRLELRACNIGKNKASMEAVRKFFGADHLTAPTLGTFYLSPIPVSTMAARARASGGPAGHGVGGAHRVAGPMGIAPSLRDPEFLNVIYARQVMAQAGPSTRGFIERHMLASGWDWSIPYGTHYLVILTIEETSLYHYRGWAAAVSTRDLATPDWTWVKWVVDGKVMPNSGYNRGAFPLAGFWNPDLLIPRGLRGDVKVPFVLPNEMVYTELLAKVP